jgi:hypothetical protein
MKFLKSLFDKTLTGKFCNLIKYGYDYIKDYEYISDTLYSDAFKIVLKSYLNVNIKKDWIGRLYGIINPNLNKDGQFDFTKTIIELDGENTNNKEYVKYWAHKQLYLIGDIFKIENLYNFIDLNFKHVGPKEADNYLIIFDIVSRKQFVNELKKLSIHAIIYAIIAAIVFVLI